MAQAQGRQVLGRGMGRCHARSRGASGRQIRQRMRQRQQSRLTCAAQYRKARFICSQHMQIGRQCRQIPGVSQGRVH